MRKEEAHLAGQVPCDTCSEPQLDLSRIRQLYRRRGGHWFSFFGNPPRFHCLALWSSHLLPFLAQRQSCRYRWISSWCRSPFLRPTGAAQPQGDHSGRQTIRECSGCSLACWDQFLDQPTAGKLHPCGHCNMRCRRELLRYSLACWDQSP